MASATSVELASVENANERATGILLFGDWRATVGGLRAAPESFKVILYYKMECSLASAGSPVELIFSAADIVGESAVWSVRDQALWWVDIIGRVIRRLDPATGGASSWPTPDLVTSIGLQARGGYIVALRR